MAPDLACVEVLDRIASELPFSLTTEQRTSLLAYVALLHKWNATYNLTSVRDPQRMLVQHIADSLAVVAPIHLRTGDREARVLDAGSGAGLPGVVLALLQPRLSVTCVDAVGKKMAFVRQVATELKLPNLQAVHTRLEAMSDPGFDIITSRAFASLHVMVGSTRHLLLRGGAWAAMKGKLPTAELAELPSEVEVFHVEPLHVPLLDAERCLVWLRAR